MLALGSAGGETFAALLPPEAMLAITAMLDPEAVPPSHPVDRALCIELALRKLVERLERELGGEIVIDEVIEAGASLPDLSWLCLQVKTLGTDMTIRLATGPIAMRRLEAFAGANADPTERAVDRRLHVKIGPIVLAADDAYGLEPGITVDCGVDPSIEVRGMLERSDGSWWPVVVNNDAIEITGPMQKPAANTVGKGSVTLGVKVGYAELSAHRRMGLVTGAQVAMQRLEGNIAELCRSSVTVATGELDVIGGRLAIRVTSVDAAR